MSETTPLNRDRSNSDYTAHEANGNLSLSANTTSGSITVNIAQPLKLTTTPGKKHPIPRHLVWDLGCILVSVVLVFANKSPQLFVNIPIWFVSLSCLLLLPFAFGACFNAQFKISSIFLVLLLATKATEFFIATTYFRFAYKTIISGALASAEFAFVVLAFARIGQEYLERSDEPAPTWGDIVMHLKAVWEVAAPGDGRFPYWQARFWSRVVLVVTSVVMVILALVENETIIWFDIAIKMVFSINLAAAFMLIFLVIVKIRATKQFQLNYTNSSLILVLGGILVRIFIDIVQLLDSISVNIYLPNALQTPYFALAKELGTIIFPLAFHFHSVFRGQQNKRELEGKVFWSFSALWVTLVIAIVGSDLYLSTRPILVTLATSSGVIAAISLCLTMISKIAPLSYFSYSFFSLGIFQHSISKLQFHRVMALRFAIYSLVHIILHAIVWDTNPNYSENGKLLHYFGSPAFITGIITVACILLSFLAAMDKVLSLSRHIPLVFLGIFVFLFHGESQTLDSTIGVTLVLTTTVLCGILYLIFNFVNSYVSLTVDNEHSFTEDNNVLLVLNADHHLPDLPPACNFRIYETNSRWNMFQGHPFSVLSVNEKPFGSQLAFFFPVTTKASITGDIHQVIKAINREEIKKFSIQGPFRGPSRSVLECIHPANTVLFLCASGSGVVPVANLVRYLLSAQLNKRNNLKVFVFYEFDARNFNPSNVLKFYQFSGIHPHYLGYPCDPHPPTNSNLYIHPCLSPGHHAQAGGNHQAVLLEIAREVTTWQQNVKRDEQERLLESVRWYKPVERTDGEYMCDVALAFYTKNKHIMDRDGKANKVVFYSGAEKEANLDVFGDEWQKSREITL